MIADCRLPIVDCGACRARRWPVGALDSRLSTLRSPLRRRRGISLLEILISIFVLAGGLLAVAALIPLGRLSLMETEKSDRTGACGRAAMREVRIRGMCDPSTWNPATPGSTVFAIDPLGYSNGLPGTLGGATGPGAVDRIALTWANTAALADPVFRWSDDLTFDSSSDATGRPRGLAQDNQGRIVPYPVLPTDPPLSPSATAWTPLYANDGSFSWFLTVASSPADIAAGIPLAQRRTFSVSVIVCQKRVLDATGESVIQGQCDTATGYGGVGVLLNGTPEIKRNEWILLYTTGATPQCTWYRVVHVGVDGTNTRVNLVGPDWHGGGTAGDAWAVIIPGVTGVYTSTVQLN